MDDDEDIPPFWLQSTTHHRRRRQQVSSFFLSSGVFLVLLLIVAFFLVFVIAPSFISFTSQIFRPHLIKKSWASLNLLLVIFAIVCGFLNINTNNGNNETARQSYYREQSLSNNVKQDGTPRLYPETPPTWYDQFQQDPTPRLSRLRSFSSYPDLRHESSWISNDERWRFYDDTHINNYRLSSSDHLNPDPPLHQETKKPQVLEVLESTETKDITVDTVVSGQDKEVLYSPPAHSPSPPAPPSPPPQSPTRHPPRPSKVVKRKVKKTYQDVEKNYPRIQENKLEEVKNFYIPPPPPPPPPPPVYGKNERRRGKDFLISLRRRKKKQRQKSVENLESFFNLEISLPSLIPPPSPPPPLPPPPPHIFQNLFSSKKGKTRKTNYTNFATPPSPPQRQAAISLVEARASVSKPQIPPVMTTQKPPKPLRTKNIEDNTESGNASPLIPIPPPPPFKIPPWKFVVDGDYVRVGSFNSSRSESPDLEENSDKLSSMSGGEGVSMSLFCPSPDVNTKADNFIATFKAGLRMEKINSLKGSPNLGVEGNSGETED